MPLFNAIARSRNAESEGKGRTPRLVQTRQPRPVHRLAVAYEALEMGGVKSAVAQAAGDIADRHLWPACPDVLESPVASLNARSLPVGTRLEAPPRVPALELALGLGGSLRVHARFEVGPGCAASLLRDSTVTISVSRPIHSLWSVALIQQWAPL